MYQAIRGASLRLDYLDQLLGAAVDCGDPEQVANADRIGTDFTEGRTVTYVCRSSCYSGGGDITCNDNGQWDTKPTCIGKYRAFFQILLCQLFVQQTAFVILFNLKCLFPQTNLLKDNVLYLATFIQQKHSCRIVQESFLVEFLEHLGCKYFSQIYFRETNIKSNTLSFEPT